MKWREIIAQMPVVFFLLVTNVWAQFYYSNGEQLPLKINSAKMCIKFEFQVGQDDQAAILDSIGRFVSVLDDIHAVDGFEVCSLTVGDEYQLFLDSVKQIDGVRMVEPYYTTVFDSAFLVGDRFCVAFETTVTQGVIDSINASLGTIIKYEITGMPNVFVIHNTPATGLGILELANLYYQLPHTRYAHPIFGVRAEQHSYKLYDHYNPYQAHLKKVIGEFNVASV